jgi:hypothetical protein
MSHVKVRVLMFKIFLLGCWNESVSEFALSSQKSLIV